MMILYVSILMIGVQTIRYMYLTLGMELKSSLKINARAARGKQPSAAENPG